MFLMMTPYPPFVGTVLYYFVVVPGTAQSVSTISVFILLSIIKKLSPVRL
jgi:hypothetical protein